MGSKKLVKNDPAISKNIAIMRNVSYTVSLGLIRFAATS
jgi:hypothetical protein